MSARHRVNRITSRFSENSSSVEMPLSRPVFSRREPSGTKAMVRQRGICKAGGTGTPKGSGATLSEEPGRTPGLLGRARLPLPGVASSVLGPLPVAQRVQPEWLVGQSGARLRLFIRSQRSIRSWDEPAVTPRSGPFHVTVQSHLSHVPAAFIPPTPKREKERENRNVLILNTLSSSQGLRTLSLPLEARDCLCLSVGRENSASGSPESHGSSSSTCISCHPDAASCLSSFPRAFSHGLRR